MKKLLSFIFMLIYSLQALSQPGSLDLTFNTVGYNTTAIGTGDDNGNALAVQADGKIVVAGDSYSGTSSDIAVVRYNEDGTIDNTFGTGGKVTTVVSTSYETAKAVLIDSVGKIVVVGYFFNSVPNFDICLVRYLNDGTLDNTFGTAGIVTTGIGTSSDLANAAALQSDGKIVVTGYYDNGSNLDIITLRYHADGTLDNTFDSDGIAITAIGTTDDYGNAIAIQSDDKIVVAGKGDANGSPDIAIVRFNADGSLDNTFATDGKATVNVNGNDNGFGLAIQSDGNLVVCGEAEDGLSYDIAVVRFTSSGTLDNTFSTDGKVSTSVGATYDGSYDVGIHADGKIVVAGKYAGSINDDIVVLRYNSDGTLDDGFSSDGKTTLGIGTNDAANALAILASGKIVVAGSSNSGTNFDFAVARFISEFGVGVEDGASGLEKILIYPNPVCNETILSYALKNNSVVTISLHDLTGKLIHTFFNQEARNSGKHEEKLMLSNRMASGDYLVRIFAPEGFASVKITIL